MNFHYTILDKHLCIPGQTPVPIRDNDYDNLPSMAFGERPVFTLDFPAGTLAEGDELTIAIDLDLYFYDQATGADAPVLTAVRHVVTAGEATANSITETLTTRTAAFRNAVNGHVRPLSPKFGVYLKHTENDIVTYLTLCRTRCTITPVIIDANAVPVELDVSVYYTRDEIDAIVRDMESALQRVWVAETRAGTAATNAESSAQNASDSATLAESYTHGQTGVRDAENSDNGLFYKTKAEEAATAAGTAKTGAETARDQTAHLAEGTDEQVAPLGAEHSAKNWANIAKGHADDAETARDQSAHLAEGTDEQVEPLGVEHSAKGWSNIAKGHADDAETARDQATHLAEGTDEQVAPLGVEHSAKGWANVAKGHADDAKDALSEFEHRLSTAYVYGIDWKDSDILAGNAGQCVVLNNIYDNAQYDKSLRYMQTLAHGVLKAHNFRRCVCSSARNANYYLHQSNSNLKADGVTPSILTGGDGDVLSEIDITYYRVDTYTDDNAVEHVVWLVSDQPFNGSQPFTYFYVSPDGRTLRKQFVGSFRSTMCDADGNTLDNNFTATTDTTYAADKTYYSRSVNVFTKLTAGTDYTVGSNITQGSTVDSKIYVKTVVTSPTGYSAGRKCRSVAGAIPSGSVTRANYRAAHGNNGYDSVHFLFGSYIGMMMTIEYGNFHAQAAFSAGYSNLSVWDFRSMRLTGRTAVFGNNSGEIVADDADANGEDYDLLSMKSGASLWSSEAQGNHAKRIVQCSYHGIEDPFGCQFTLDEGIQKNQDAIDLSITYNGNVYLRDEADDPQSITLYCWKLGTASHYTTTATPSVGDNLYKNSGLSEITGTVVSYDSGGGTLVVGSSTYTRSAANDTVGHSYAWKNGSDVIYSHVVNPHTDAATRQVFSDAQLTELLGNVTAVVDDYSESGYWMTHATSKYSMLDTNRGRLAGDEYVFPVTGYTGEEIVWVHHEWPKASIYPSFFDRVTFLPKYRTGNWGSITKGLCDYLYNNANAGACVLARGGNASSGGNDGPFCVYVAYGLSFSHASFGSRSAA